MPRSPFRLFFPRITRSIKILPWLRSLQVHRLGIVVQRSFHHRLAGLSAEIAYNAIFSLFPAILTLLAAIGLLKLPETELHNLLRDLNAVIPDAATTLIQIVIDELRRSASQELFSVSFGMAIWVSSSVMGSIMSALDQIHRVPRHQHRPFWKAKLVAIGLSLGTMVLLMAALTTVLIGEMGIHLMANHSHFFAPTLLWLWQSLSLPIALGILGASLGFIYRYGPSRWQKGSPVFPGTLVATGLWAIVSGAFRFSVITFNRYNQAYGAIGAVIILLLWLYLSAFALLIGAEVNAVLGEAQKRLKSS
jgi:membrane protein